jgi:sensor histidine kinase regulating citrate/malate metabolism
LRRRLVLAFAYVLCAVILALTLPLALNLRERATAELLGSATVTAQSVAAAFDLDAMADPAVLRGRTTRFAREIDGRVIVIDDEGIVLADANPFPEPATSAVGSRYATPQRPEVSTALVGGRADAVVRESRELETDLLLASAPIVDDPRGPIEVVGAVRITLDVERVSEAVGRATWAVVAIGLASLVAGLIVALALARTLTRPLTKLAAAV